MHSGVMIVIWSERWNCDENIQHKRILSPPIHPRLVYIQTTQ